MYNLVWLMVSLGLVSQLTESYQVRDLELVDGGYNGLLVEISEDLQQQHCNALIHGLKNVFGKFSGELWTATGGRASLRDVTVFLPASWRTDALSCSLVGPITPTAMHRDAHIHVGGAHPVFASWPWAQQSEGCGRPGDFIHIGGDLVRSSGSMKGVATRAGQRLTAEWAKFRWGVFSEQGHVGDPLYPVTISRDGMEVLNTCLPEGSTAPFCATEDHSPEAPNKHNALCGGSSAWEVIMESQDFANGRNEPTNRTSLVPTLHFVQPTAPTVVFVVEDTAVMNLQRRWEFVRKALRRVVVYDVPDGAHVGVVVFNSVASTAAPVSQMESHSDVRTRIGSSLPRNPSRVPESHKCLLCGMQEGLRALDVKSLGDTGATFIIVTSGSNTVPQQELEELIRLSTERNIKINIVFYPVMEHRGLLAVDQGLQHLAQATYGQTISVMDEGVGNDSKVTMMVSLMDALLNSLRYVGPAKIFNTPMIIHGQSYPGGIESQVHGKFEVDNSMGPNIRIAIYYYDLNHVGNKIHITTPSGKRMSSVNIQEEDGDANVIFVNIHKAERGVWAYELENHATSHQSLYIQVTGTESEANKINLRVWTNKDHNAKNKTEPLSPTIIYAEVKDGMLPVLNAKVVAKLKRLGTDTSGNTYPAVYIHLLDSGLGDPDITGGDGVYSRYLPNIEILGQYELSFLIDHNNGLAVKPVKNVLTRNARVYQNTEKDCCGSIINYEHVTPVQAFKRIKIYGSIVISTINVKGDTMPPNRILDLRSTINLKPHKVTLHWTAPGNDYDWGRANRYEVTMATTWKDAYSFSGEKITGMPVPLSFGSDQIVDLVISKYDEQIFIAVRAIDDSDNYGSISNIISMLIPSPPTTTVAPTTPIIMGSSIIPNEPIGEGITQPLRVVAFSFDDMAIIIGSVMGFLITIAIFAILCYLQVIRHKPDSTKESDSGENVTQNKTSPNIIDHNQTHESIESDIKESNTGRSLSPVPSWTASKLLQEHEQRLCVTNSLLTDDNNTVSFHNIQGSFPDVTLTSGNAYSYQEASIDHSEPPAYNVYSEYSYDYNPNYSHDDLPPYTQQGPLLQTAVSHSNEHNPATTIYQNDLQSYIENPELNFPTPPPAMYAIYANELAPENIASIGKVPPPVAPKPSLAVRAATATAVINAKHRNVTQV
ncbi:unnamed protein product [Meganyctiphanes norvegica]|uniref:Uncharacterized protein n=1 Tax=Meganyctiphanes norvegica TaxID=48144 RepID=A0AAV2R3Q1_MEGNR